MNIGKGGRTPGLHARLLFWLVVTLVVAWLLIWGNTQHIIKDLAARDVDRRLQSTATLLLQLYVDDQRLRDDAGQAVVGQAGSSPRYLVETAQGTLIARSSDFPEVARSTGAGFADRDAGPRHWRVFTLVDQGHNVTVRVALTPSTKEAYTDELNRAFAPPLFWLLPVLMLLAFFSVWRGLAPLRAIERSIAGVDPIDPQPLNLGRRGVPTELYELLTTLNQLIARVREVLVRQRAFTVGAGHELRTPLTGCRTQLHVAVHSDDESRRRRALEQAGLSLDRMAALLEQLLFFARLDPAAPPMESRDFRLDKLIQRVVSSLQAQAARGGVRLVDLTAETPAQLKGSAVLMEALISNLLKNAIRFSTPDGEVRVALRRHGGMLCLSVMDQGAGLTAEQRQRIFEPFYKGDGPSGRSTGLGLAIVEAVAQAHGGHAMALPAAGGGTELRIQLPDNSSRRKSS